MPGVALLLPGRAIWAFAPEKVLATRTDWAETEPHLLARLMRAVWRAGRWLGLAERAGSAPQPSQKCRQIRGQLAQGLVAWSLQ